MRYAALLLAACASACSPIFMKKAPSEPEPQRWPRCTEHRLYPVIDALATVYAATGTAVVIASDDDLAELGLLVFVPMLIGYGASTFYGFHQAGRCASAREAYEAAAIQGR